MSMESHYHEHTHDGDHMHSHAGAVAERRTAYAPVQFASLGVGVFFIVVGAIALARMGFTVDNMRSSSTEVLGIGMTPLLAWMHLAIGVVALLCAAGRQLARGGMLILGSLMLASGIIVILKPDILSTWFAMNTTNGVAYLVSGGVGVAMTIGTPITWTRRRTYGSDREVPAM